MTTRTVGWGNKAAQRHGKNKNKTMIYCSQAVKTRT